METRPRHITRTISKTPSIPRLRWPVSELWSSTVQSRDLMALPQPFKTEKLTMPPTLEARTADRVIACLRKAIEELAAGRPWNALAMVADAQDSASALRDLIKGQISNDELGIHNAPPALGAS